MLTVRRAVLCLLWNDASEWMIWQLLDLLSHGPPEEGRDLGAGAGGVGVETTAAHTGGNTVFDGPSHGLRVVAVSGNVSKAGARGSGRLTHGAPQHGDHLGAVDGAVGVRAVGNALLLGPRLRLLVPIRAAGQIRVGLPGQHGPELGAGGGGIGREGVGAGAVQQAAGADEVDVLFRPVTRGVREVLGIIHDLDRGVAVHGELDAVLGGPGVLDDLLGAVRMDDDRHSAGLHVGNGNFHLGVAGVSGQLDLDGGGGAGIAEIGRAHV